MQTGTGIKRKSDKGLLSGKKKAILAAKCLDAKKASDIVILEVTALSTIADYFVIATAESKRQVKSCADYIDETLIKKGIRSDHMEGINNLEWVLMDYGDIIIHIFDKDSRLYYGLERLWGDAPNVSFRISPRKKVTRTNRKNPSEVQS